MSELEDNSQGSLSDIPTRHDGVSQHLALLEDKECRTEKTPVLLSQLLDIVHTDRTQCQKARQTTLSYNSEFAPVNRLPIEVLQDIFMHCCPPVKERGDVLWDLERVSRKWRQTALGCTVLWSFITVSSDVLKWYRVRDPHRMLEIWLERSRKRPLNITFGAFNGDQDPPPSLFPLLLLHIQRWRTLMLGIYFDAGIIGSLKSAQGKLPLLHSLSLFIRTKRDNPVTTAICLDAFSDAPNLHHMSLSLHECYRINNPSNSLTSLAVLNPDFLKNLTFPNLKVLCVTDYCQSDGGLDMFSAILQFIQRSRCQHLKALILGPTKAVVGSAVKEVFRIVPKLEILGIRVNKEDAFLEIFSLLQVSEDRALLPSLHVLDVTLNIGSTVTTQTAQLMVDLLEGRRGQDQMITKLESFVWRHARPIQALHLVEARLKRLKDDGLSISFKGGILPSGFSISDDGAASEA